MNWILPIAGKGKRVKLLGSFKPFIRIHDKKIIEWFFLGIRHKIKTSDEFYFISTKNYEISNRVSLNIKKIFKKLKLKNKVIFKFLDKTPNGPALTVETILNSLTIKKPCVIINCDQIIDFELPKINKNNQIIIPVYFNSSGKSSYVNINKRCQITGIFEKRMISYYASSGVYIFSSTELLQKCFKKLQSRNLSKELFMSDIINNYLIKEKLRATPIPTLTKHDLGNINDINSFRNLLYKRKN